MSPTRTGSRRRFAAANNSGSANDNVRKHRPDYSLIVYMTMLLALGAVTVYAISPGITAAQGLSEGFYSSKQLIAIGLGVAAFLVVSVMNLKTWRKLETPLLIAAVVVALAVRLLGDPINGAYRWLDIGGMSFQAAELIKITLVVWLAGYLTRRRIEQKIQDPETFKMLGIVSVVVLVVVAGLQSDLGSAAVMLAIIGFMSMIAGLQFKKILIAGAVALVLVGVAIMISPYRRDRVATFLNPTADCKNEGYQACQALITVGSGGMFGKGLGRSVQAYGYLPEAANDSIFAIVAEKYGFVGASLMVGVFIAMFRKIKLVAENAPNEYARLLVSGILAWLSVQMMINVGAMIGIIPLKGITLPFVSYGGTSIIFVMSAMGIVFHVSRYTVVAGREEKSRGYGQREFTQATRIKNRRWSEV